jgi:hypothetical protein
MCAAVGRYRTPSFSVLVETELMFDTSIAVAPVRVRSIRFDRQGAGGALALPVKRDSKASVPAVDWLRSQEGVTSTAVAYSGRLDLSTRPMLSVAISILTSFSTAIQLRARARQPFPLGDTVPVAVPSADQGDVLELAVTVQSHQLASRGVSDVVVEWVWEFSRDTGHTWVPCDETSHRVFVLLDEPAFPWGRPDADDRVSPWADVLDIACRWAAGARDREQVTDTVTQGVHDIGGQQIKQPCGDVVTIQYEEWTAFQSFDGLNELFCCSDFIKLIRLQPTNLFTVNCLDCANAVALFAAVVGCPLRRGFVTPMQPDGRLATKRVWLIGRPSADFECFLDHTVALAPASGEGRVWDACLKVDLDPAPQRNPPADWGLAMGLRMDPSAAALGYRQRFLAEGSQDVRMAIEPPAYPDSAPAGATPFVDAVKQQRRGQYFRMMVGAHCTRLTAGLMTETVMSSLGVTQTQLRDTRAVAIGRRRYPVVFVPIRAAGAESRLRLGVLLAATRPHALRAFIDLVMRYTAPVVPVREVADFGFYCADNESLLLLWGRLVLVLLNDPARGVPIMPQARRLTQRLTPVVLPTN